MTLPEVRAAKPHEHDAVLSTVTLAFAADPVNRWYLPDADRFVTHFPKVVGGFLGLSIEAGACYVTSNLEGAAIWMPPGVAADDDVMGEILMAATPPHLQEGIGTLFGAFEAFHPHDDDCWYLPVIGVDPAHQGKGIGAALMKHATNIVDGLGALSYLESSTPKNIPLYQRHGFEAMGEVPYGDAGGVATPMLRARRMK